MTHQTVVHKANWITEVRENARWYALLVCVMIFGISISFFLYAGPNPWGDDATYIWLSTRPLLGPLTMLSNRFSSGFLKVLILKASFGAFGYGNIQAILPNIIEYLILIFMTFLIGSRFRDAKTGVVAAFLAATAPLAVANVTTVLPDIGTGMMLSISLYIFMRSLNTRHNALLPSLFGVSATLALYMNEEGFITLLLSWLYVILLLITNAYSWKVLRRRNVTSLSRHQAGVGLKYGFFALLGTAASLSIYFLVFYLSLGAPFSVLRHIDFGYSLISPLAEINTIFFSNFLAGNQFNVMLYPLGPISILAIVGTAILLARGSKYDNFISFLTWGFVILIVFGTLGILNQHGYFPVVTRFFNIVLAPIAVLGAYALTSAYDFLESRNPPTILAGIPVEPVVLIIAVLFMVVLANTSLYNMLLTNNLQIHNSTQTVYSVAEFIENYARGEGNITIYTHTAGGFNYVMPLFMWFAMDFNNSVHFYSINTSYIQTSPSCNLLQENGPSFLVAAYNNYAPEIRSQVCSETESWLSTNCTATLLAQINQTDIYSLKSRT